MKFLTLTMASAVTASDLLKVGEEVMQKVVTQTLQGEADVTMDGLRTITQADMDLINEYGCWCYFQDGYGQGRSKPLDEIDTLCKRLHDGYTCAIMDSRDLGDECVPWEVSYNSAIGSGMLIDMDIATIRQECDVQNPDNGCPN